jgi:hypothetical protein
MRTIWVSKVKQAKLGMGKEWAQWPIHGTIVFFVANVYHLVKYLILYFFFPRKLPKTDQKKF